MNKVKIAVVGVGHLGKIHTKLWSENSLAELVGVYDANQEVAKQVAKLYGIKSFENLDEVSNEVEGVTISSTTITHYEIAKFFLCKNIHCFIEKPITANFKEGQDLLRIASDNNVVIQVGHVERFNPAIVALSDFEINPLFIEAHRLSQFKPRAFDVSVIHDLMIHDIDLVLSFVKSNIKSIDANGVSILTNTPDICNARLKFENGTVANLTASRLSSNQMRKMRIFQKNAYISIDFAKPDVDIFKIVNEEENSIKTNPTSLLGSIESGLKNKNIHFEKPSIPTLNAISEEQKAFVESITNGIKNIEAVNNAIEALRIAEHISEII